EAIVELDVGLVSRDDALFFCELLADRSVVRPLEYASRPEIVVLKNDFIMREIEADGAVRGVGVTDHTLGLEGPVRSWWRRSGRSRSVLRPRRLLQRSHLDCRLDWR